MIQKCVISSVAELRRGLVSDRFNPFVLPPHSSAWQQPQPVQSQVAAGGSFSACNSAVPGNSEVGNYLKVSCLMSLQS